MKYMLFVLVLVCGCYPETAQIVHSGCQCSQGEVCECQECTCKDCKCKSCSGKVVEFKVEEPEFIKDIPFKSLSAQEQYDVLKPHVVLITDPDTCPPCRKIEKETLPVLIQEGYIIGKHIIKQKNGYGVKSIPTWIFFNNNVEVRRIQGFITPEMFKQEFYARPELLTGALIPTIKIPNSKKPATLAIDVMQSIMGGSYDLGIASISAPKEIELNIKKTRDGIKITFFGDEKPTASILGLRVTKLQGIDIRRDKMVINLKNMFDLTVEFK